MLYSLSRYMQCNTYKKNLLVFSYEAKTYYLNNITKFQFCSMYNKFLSAKIFLGFKNLLLCVKYLDRKFLRKIFPKSGYLWPGQVEWTIFPSWLEKQCYTGYTLQYYCLCGWKVLSFWAILYFVIKMLNFFYNLPIQIVTHRKFW